jgi:hypothetical protein
MALSVTLAPFTAPEKPHLSPTLAASFSKDANSYLRGDLRRMTSFRRTQPEGETISFRKILILLNFFGQNGSAPGTLRMIEN